MDCVRWIQEGLGDKWGINALKKIVSRVENLVAVYGGEEKEWYLKLVSEILGYY